MNLSSIDLNPLLTQLAKELDGEFFYDEMRRAMYATDASEYREYPIAIAYPKGENDIIKIIKFVSAHQLSIIPRAAGTSLAGQCVGNGIIVDVSRHWREIIEINIEEGYVVVEPGVIRDELNEALLPYGYFFSPITSTANRAMVGGMVGNNSSGTTSIRYGVTRDKIIYIDTILSDGTKARFEELDKGQITDKLKKQNLESEIYQQLITYLSQEENRTEILNQFPKKAIHRRNTGYAVDALLENELFTNSEQKINLGKLLCGSEGTLAFTIAVKLKIDPLPPPISSIIAIHCNGIKESLIATQIVMESKPYACELMDKTILDCTKSNLTQNKNRWFIEGDPQAILLVECNGHSALEVQHKTNYIIEALKVENIGYAYPIIPQEKTKAVWQLRSAGLGLLANLSNDKRAVACIEDTAVALDDLPNYIEEFDQIMERHDQKSVYYAHAGAGELHLRPILDLRKKQDVTLFETITLEVAHLVKKYNGSLSGEHGDGRVRSPFIPYMVGQKNYSFFKAIKHTWDPLNIFNPGKIIDPKSMKRDLRSENTYQENPIPTFINFKNSNGIEGLASKCNGSGDCRKLPLSGGTMCPSYQATLDEKDTTRARANVLREFLNKKSDKSPFEHKEISEILDLCISCKGCTSECPSNVDMSLLKAEVSYQQHKIHGMSTRSWFFSNVDKLNAILQIAPRFFNTMLNIQPVSFAMKSILGIAQKRQIPKVYNQSLRSWYNKNQNSISKDDYIKEVVLFCDEFTNRLDVGIGIKAIRLLQKLNYKVTLVEHAESGRASISKGNLEIARNFAQDNIDRLFHLASKGIPIIGIEPSAILSFRDEYPVLVTEAYRAQAIALSEHCLLIDEFLAQEIDVSHITSSSFDDEPRHMLLHGHCHQKALSDLSFTEKVLTIPSKHTLEVIPSGCCGMAGSFGYEKEHYDLSIKIGNLVLFPSIRSASTKTIIIANGTSCRHQIMDGTARESKHMIEILYEALLDKY